MKVKYIISLLAYISALVLGEYYLYLLIPLFFFLYKDKAMKYLKKYFIKNALYLGVIGGGSAILIQYLWGFIQRYLLNMHLKSIHTNELISHAKAGVGMILLICVVCPILEEIIFRKIIFEALKMKCGMTGASIISALVFSLIHFDFYNTMFYLLIGLAFSFIYTRSKSLLNSIAAHMFMNTIVLLIQI